jgi:hypothetical protein
MPNLTIEYRDESERLVLEQAIGFVHDLRRLAMQAPDGTVLDVCEKAALDQGRGLLRTTLTAALQCRIASAEQKGGRRGRVRTRTPTPLAPKAVTPDRC